MSDILNEIDAVIDAGKKYSGVGESIEVERLFWIPSQLENTVRRLESLGLYSFNNPVEQHDRFFDTKNNGRWLLAETDHYIRVRSERSGALISCEVKVAYPGLMSNPSARPSFEKKIEANEVPKWTDCLINKGLEPERTYRKTRTGGLSKSEYDGDQIAKYVVAIEADHFDVDACNGALASQTFITLSIECSGDERYSAEIALDNALRVIEREGIELTKCTTNYEGYFYGEKIPSHRAREVQEMSINAVGPRGQLWKILFACTLPDDPGCGCPENDFRGEHFFSGTREEAEFEARRIGREVYAGDFRWWIEAER